MQFDYMREIHVEVEEEKLDDEQSHVENIDYINYVETLDSNIHMENNRIEKPLGNGSLYGQNDSLCRDIDTGLQITTQQVKVKEERVKKDGMVFENVYNSHCFERRSIKQEVVESNNELENLHLNLENNKNVPIFENTDSCNQGSDDAMGANMIEIKQESQGPEEQTFSLEDKFKAEYLNSEFADPTSTSEKSDLSVTSMKWKGGSCYLENSDTGAINIYLGSEFNDFTGRIENNDFNLENKDLNLKNSGSGMCRDSFDIAGHDFHIEEHSVMTNPDFKIETLLINVDESILKPENKDFSIEKADSQNEATALRNENTDSITDKMRLEIVTGFQPVVVLKRLPDTVFNKQFKKAFVLGDNTASHSTDRPHECNKCDKRFQKAGQLKSHMASHSTDRPYKCSVCKKGFKRLTWYSQHLVTHRAGLLYKCSVCEKDFKCSKDLTNHMRNHNKERLFKCPICKKDFRKSISLRNHTCMLHVCNSIGRPYKCSICKKGFKSSKLRSQHMVTHRTELLYKCSVCEKDFKCSQYLRNHMRNHNEERRFKCSICKKDFRKSISLRNHTCMLPVCNSIERPFKCSICKKGFMTLQVQRDHMLVHETERPYKCSVCEKDFKSLKHLRHHMSIHTTERPHKCNLCDVGFKTWGHLKSHISSKAHGNNICVMLLAVKESTLPVV